MTCFARREGLAVLSGVLLILSFPKFGHGVVAWVALGPLLVALPGTSPFQAFRLGYLTGAVSSLGLLYWTALVVIQYGGLSFPVGIGVMTLLCLAVALFPSLFALVVSRWAAVLGPVALVLAPFAWVATELLRRHTFLDFPWCLLGYSQHDHLAFIQIASVTAVYGVSFLVAASSALVAYAGVMPRHRGRVAAALVVLLGTIWAHGTWALSRPLPETGRLRVGLVQAGILQEEKWEPEDAWSNVGRHLALTRRAADRGARLVVWPESAVPFYFDRAPDLAELLRRTVREKQINLLFGNDDRQDLPNGTYRAWVGAKMLTPEGDVALRYHKMKLVPFGEYVPLHALLTLGGRVAAKMVQQVSDFTPGTEPVVVAADGHRLGVFICYEAIFPDLVREFTARGADLLVNITNDAWYGRTSAPYQHMAMAAFRAVENGKYLVRAANTGITGVVDPRGRVLEPTTLFDRTVLVRDVPIVPGRTFYSRHGDVFAWGCFGAALALTAGTLRRRS